jgi:membrane protein
MTDVATHPTVTAPPPGTAPTPTVPHGAAGWRAVARDTAARAKADRVSMMAGSIAFHSFLAIFPALIAVIGVIQLAGASTSFVTELVHGIGRALPDGASTVLTDALQSAHRRTGGALVATLVAVAVAVWSASTAMVVLQSGLTSAYPGVPDRGFVAKRGMSVVLLVVVLVLGGTAAALIVFAAPLGRSIQPHTGIPEGVFTVVWTIARWVVTVGVLVVLMAAVYRLAPNRRSAGWAWRSAGGALAAVGFLVASVGLSFYVSSLGSYARIYGALAGVVVLMLWLYLSAYVVLVGGQLNAAIERRAAPGVA